MNGQSACELISRYLKDTEGVDVEPEAIWNASQTGELAHVFAWYWEARAHYANARLGIRLDGTIELIPR